MDTGAGSSREAITEVIDARDVHVVFQPIVDLTSTEAVGFEALARGPEGSALENPAALFGAAREHGLTAELDWLCRAAAFAAFFDAKAAPALTLFVNVEPDSFGTECPPDLAPMIARAEKMLRVIVEVNDRALREDPAELLAAERRARLAGWGIALDDVGTGRGAIGMIPVVRPDVVKLDLTRLRAGSDGEAAAVILAATRHAEHTGASICIESIETAEDARWARALGARYGQGYFFGAPGPLPTSLHAPRRPVPLVAPSEGDQAGDTPWGLLESMEPLYLDPDHFISWARIIAQGSIAPGAAPVILTGVGRGGFDQGVAETFPEQADPLLSVAFGVGVSEAPWPGIRGVSLQATDAMADALFLVVISAVGGFALLGEPDAGGRIRAIVTQEPHVVDDIARHLIRRVPRLAKAVSPASGTAGAA